MLKVPFSPPDITEEEINEVVEALEIGVDHYRTKDKRI